MDLQIRKGPSGRVKGLRDLLAGMKREDVLAVLPVFSLSAAASYRYAESTDFDLVHEGRRYPPKAVLGLAAERVVGRPLTSEEFTGGEKSTCFAILNALGFEIVKKISNDSVLFGTRGLDRFQLYERKEIAKVFEPDVGFTPGAGRWGIQGIVETPKESGNFVFMVTLGKLTEGNPYQDALTVDGYLIWESQTRQSFESPVIQKLLVHDPQNRDIHLFLRPNRHVKYSYIGMLEYFSHDPNKTNPVHFVWRIQNWDLSPEGLDRVNLPFRPPLDPAYSPAIQPPVSQNLVQVAVPGAARRKASTRSAQNGTVDWAIRDLRNRELGGRGEKLVLDYEVDTLRAAGLAELAEQVRHVALYNSAAGFDIASFQLDGSPKRIEVKTTEGPESTPFYISANEVRVSSNHPESYVIYRVFNLRPENVQVQFFELPGNVEESCGLDPVSFRAYPGRSSE
ncbi:DUF3427 domain-containing protein [Pseudomonas sp. PLMAX]|uniref:DUF3427 domain-containing protein n=1 Tax=Pseudomonas sp. PLMAX TaxID=2201998 RepID=UPI0038BA5BDE